MQRARVAASSSRFRLAQIQPVDQHRQLFRPHGDAAHFLRRGPAKSSFLQTLAHTHSPLPSHTSAFSRVRERFVNRNKWPLNGSWPR